MRNYAELQYNSKEGWNSEMYLTSLTFNMFHALSLVWSKREKKYTEGYMAYLTYEVLSDFFNTTDLQNIDKDIPLDEWRGMWEPLKATQMGKDDIVYGMVSDYILLDAASATTISDKVGIFLYLVVEVIGIPEQLIFDCFKPQT